MDSYALYSIIGGLLIGIMFLLAKMNDDKRKRATLETELKVLSSSREGVTLAYQDVARDRDEYKRLLELADRDIHELRSRLMAVVTVEAHKAVPHRDAVRDMAHYQTVDELAVEIGRQVKPHVLITRLMYADSVSYTARLSLYKGGESQNGTQRQAP